MMQLSTLVIDRPYSYDGAPFKPLKGKVELIDGESKISVTLSIATIGKIINLVALEVQTNATNMARNVTPSLRGELLLEAPSNEA